MQGSSKNYLSFPLIASHNSWLDALRALAIVLVLMRHGVKFDSAGFASSGFMKNIFSNGWVGVDLFFVLSGYLIAKSLLKRIGAGHRLFSWRYFEARILRIVPAYYVVLMLCAIGFFPFFAIEPAGLDTRVLYHSLFLQDYLGSNINVVFWSLGVEEKFYILVPLLILALLKIRSHFWQFAFCLGLLALSPIARSAAFAGADSAMDYQAFFNQLRSPFHMSLEGFVVGIMAALGQRRGWLLSARRATVVLPLCLGGLLIWTASHEFLDSITLFDASVQPLLLALVFGTMLSCCLSLADRRLPLEPAARVTSRLSYALYLVHFPLIPLAFVLTQGNGSLAFWCAYLLISTCGALAIHFIVEKPFLKLKDRPAAARSGQLKTLEANV